MGQSARQHLEGLRRAARRRATANDAWRSAIVAASEAGLSTRAIAEAAGISHVRVSQIVQEERKEDGNGDSY